MSERYLIDMSGTASIYEVKEARETCAVEASHSGLPSEAGREKLFANETLAEGPVRGSARKEEAKNLKLGKRLKIFPKSLVPANCCYPNTLSIEETYEGKTSIATNPGPTLVCIENSDSIDMKLECLSTAPKSDTTRCEAPSSCKCNRKGIEYDLLKIERNSAKSFEYSTYISSTATFSSLRPIFIILLCILQKVKTIR